MSRRWKRLSAIAVVIGGPALFLLYYIDDWRRDFTTNTATTDEYAADPLLRPLQTGRSAAELAQAVRIAAERLGGWESVGRAADDGTATLLYVRTTPVWRFKDDVTLRIEELGDRRRLHGESHSRVGRADLGQNPRNLRAILSEVRDVLHEFAARDAEESKR